MSSTFGLKPYCLLPTQKHRYKPYRRCMWVNAIHRSQHCHFLHNAQAHVTVLRHVIRAFTHVRIFYEKALSLYDCTRSILLCIHGCLWTEDGKAVHWYPQTLHVQQTDAFLKLSREFRELHYNPSKAYESARAVIAYRRFPCNHNRWWVMALQTSIHSWQHGDIQSAGNVGCTTWNSNQ